VELLWEGVDILEDEDFDETRLAMNSSMQKINMKRNYIWKWLSRNHPGQEIIITSNDHVAFVDTNGCPATFRRTTTFNTNNYCLTLSGVQFEKVDINKPLEEWVFNF
jgi:hypothetical protein